MQEALKPPQLSRVQGHKWPHGHLHGQSQARGTGFMSLGRENKTLLSSSQGGGRNRCVLIDERLFLNFGGKDGCTVFVLFESFPPPPLMLP